MIYIVPSNGAHFSRGLRHSGLPISQRITRSDNYNLHFDDQRLTFGTLAIGLLANPGGKVVTVYELLSGLQEGSGHGRQIQPVVLSSAFGAQAKVEIEAVDIAIAKLALYIHGGHDGSEHLVSLALASGLFLLVVLRYQMLGCVVECQAFQVVLIQGASRMSWTNFKS